MKKTDINLAAARGVALFFGAMSLIGAVFHCARPDFDPNLWWVDLRILPIWARVGLEMAAGVALLGWAALAGRQPQWSQLAAGAAGGLAVAAAVNGTIVVGLFVGGGAIHSRFPVPASLLFAAVFSWLALTSWRCRTLASPSRPATVLAVLAACMVLFPVLQVMCFGWTNYRRPADVAVVFGARAYANGEPSMALADRVRAAAELYNQGAVKRLYFSGGPGDGVIHETESMRRLALRLGVPDSAISVDLAGLNTEATTRHTLQSLAERGETRVLAVSEFYHLPRIKLCFQGHGAEVYTVPAQPEHWLRAWPLASIIREIPAFWLYYARALRRI